MRFIKVLFVLFLPISAMIAQEAQNLGTCEHSTGKACKAGYSLFYNTMAEMTWPEIKKAAEENPLIILPVAVIEEHGPHMATGTDILLAHESSVILKQKLDSIGIKSLIVPPVYWGHMQIEETGKYPGSFSVSPATMKSLLADIFADLKRWGFNNIYCGMFHGDRIHIQSMNEAIAAAKEKLGLNFFNKEEDEEAEEEAMSKFVTGELYQPDYHAGAYETSAMLNYYPHLVRTEIVKTLAPENGFHPLGYAGDPANYKSVNMAALLNWEAEMNAHDLAEWLSTMESKD